MQFGTVGAQKRIINDTFDVDFRVEDVELGSVETDRTLKWNHGDLKRKNGADFLKASWWKIKEKLI